MPVDTAAIQQNSITIFAILQQAQLQNNDLTEKIAELNTENKLRAQSDSIRGQVIDLVA